MENRPEERAHPIHWENYLIMAAIPYLQVRTSTSQIMLTKTRNGSILSFEFI